MMQQAPQTHVHAYICDAMSRRYRIGRSGTALSLDEALERDPIYLSVLDDDKAKYLKYHHCFGYLEIRKGVCEELTMEMAAAKRALGRKADDLILAGARLQVETAVAAQARSELGEAVSAACLYVAPSEGEALQGAHAAISGSVSEPMKDTCEEPAVKKRRTDD